MREFVLGLCLLLIATVAPHRVKEVTASSKEVVSGFVNQTLEIPIPFKKCFRAKTELEANDKYIDFKPTRIELNALKSFSLQDEGVKISVLQDLLSPIIYKHGHMVVFDGYLMVFFAPKTILIVEETNSGFQIKNQYKVQGIGRFDKFKMYQLGNKALLVTYNKNKVYLLDTLDYEVYELPTESTMSHLTELNSMEFYAAEFMKGLTHYKLNPTSKKVEVVKVITGETLGRPKDFKYVVDVSLNFLKEGIILALDVQQGLVQLKMGEEEITSKVVVAHKMCESFDSIDLNHIVLLCQNQGHSTILEVYREVNPRTKEQTYRKLEPIFQVNYLNDLHVTDSYYSIYSYKNIHIFWNTRKNRLPETLETQSEIVLPGLETFTFTRDKEGSSFLFTVEGGVLYKYALEEKPAELTVKVEQPTSKAFKLFIYGSCEDIEPGQGKERVEACRLSRNMVLQIGEEEYPREQDFGISATIIGILVIVFLLVIWICLKKYKGLEQEARKVLKNYQNKKIRATRQI